MSRPSAALATVLLAAATGGVGYFVGDWFSNDTATPDRQQQDGAFEPLPSSVPNKAVQDGALGTDSGEQRAVFDAMNAWLVERGAAALIRAIDDERFEPILQGLVELAARAHPSILIDALTRDTSNRLIQIVGAGDLLLHATGLLARDANARAETAEAMRYLASSLGTENWLAALAKHLARTDPDVAADLASGLKGSGQAWFLASAAENLPSDGAVVAEWLDRHRGFWFHDRLVEVAVNSLARRDVEAAAELATSMLAAGKDVSFDFARTLAANDPEKAISLFAHNKRRQEDIAAGWAEMDPEAAVSWYVENGMHERANMGFDDVLQVLARTDPERAEQILANYPASESDKGYPAAVLAEYLDTDEDASRIIAAYGINETFTMRRRAELWERIESCPPPP